ncbi:tax-4 [Pristionchus pacificus]|uniref:Tax-4 n=1 Tax=Pristionchus pacificus TaxID=54126 RepID=A0A2A6BQI4_PRIPA|nr:tax-4 [Pristionchus pacificus]|eukprot:PDM68212.1 tax-4 [Pristionchus pacificus]
MLLQGTNAVASRSSPLAANGGASNGGIDENHPEDERNGICSKQTISEPAPEAPRIDKYILDKSSNLYYRIAWMFFDILTDGVYIADIVMKTRTGFLEQGLLVRDSRRIREQYMRSVEFRWDVLSMIPADYIFNFVRKKIGRAVDALERTETRYIIIIIHWNACFYFFLSEYLGLGSDTWVYGEKNKQSLPDGINDTLVRRYVYSFYWSTLTLTTIGEVPGPVQNCEFVFVTCDLMCGVLIFATIVGNVGSMISNMSAARAEFQNKMDGVKQYMALRKVSPNLEDRVIKWFDYLWSNKQSLNDESVLKVLPDKLQAEIAMHVHFETLRKVRIFQDCESGLLAELVLKLQLQVFSPGDYICRKGDIGREMYIVKRGKLQVVSSEAEDATVFATLQEGSVFGELSILNIRGSKNGNRRTANVRSVGYTDLFVLNKNDLWIALKEYPDARRMLLLKGRELLRKDNLLDDDAPDEQASPEEIVDDLLQSINVLQTRVARLMAEKTSTEAKLNTRIEILERELVKYKKKRAAKQSEPRFARSHTLAADFDPHDLITDCFVPSNDKLTSTGSNHPYKRIDYQMYPHIFAIRSQGPDRWIVVMQSHSRKQKVDLNFGMVLHCIKTSKGRKIDSAKVKCEKGKYEFIDNTSCTIVKDDELYTYNVNCTNPNHKFQEFSMKNSRWYTRTDMQLYCDKSGEWDTQWFHPLTDIWYARCKDASDTTPPIEYTKWLESQEAAKKEKEEEEQKGKETTNNNAMASKDNSTAANGQTINGKIKKS